MSIQPVSFNNISTYRSVSSLVDSVNEPLHSFAKQDEAIISAQAKLLNELDKYNSGNGDEISLALTCVTSKLDIEANIKVIQAKDEMLGTILKLGDEE